MAIFDVFPFHNELDLLELRLRMLDDYVDYFVLSESSTTLSGFPKTMHFEANKSRFGAFNDRIIHIPIHAEFQGSTFGRDEFQRDQVHNTLANIMSGRDLLIYSDLDEIPNPNSLSSALSVASDNRMAHMAQNVYVYFLNFHEVSRKFISYTGEYPNVKERKWLGSRAVTYDYARRFGMTELRSPFHKELGVRIDDGGWHFTYCGGLPGIAVEDRVREKLVASPHQELMSKSTLRRIPDRIRKGRDPWGRRGVKMKRVRTEEALGEHSSKIGADLSHMVLQ